MTTTNQVISQLSVVMGLANAVFVVTIALAATTMYLMNERTARLIVAAAIFVVTIGVLATGKASDALVFGVLIASGLLFPLFNRRHQTEPA
jgi:chromate transport protein ChrA